MRNPVLIIMLIASVSGIVAAVSLAIAEDPGSSTLWAATATIAFFSLVIAVPVLLIAAVIAWWDWRSAKRKTEAARAEAARVSPPGP
jgi:heme/copper-type cytochrome/quinol oxidase subunit 2